MPHIISIQIAYLFYVAFKTITRSKKYSFNSVDGHLNEFNGTAESKLHNHKLDLVINNKKLIILFFWFNDNKKKESRELVKIFVVVEKNEIKKAS